MNMVRVMGLAAVAALLVPMVAEAQAPRRAFELGIFGGYRVGGEILREDNDLFDFDVDVEDAVAYGIRAEIPVSEWVSIELLASRQPTEFVRDNDLFGGNTGLLDVDISYYHAGVVLQWGPGQVKPFVVASLGIAQINPDLPGLSTEERLSGSIGGGVKVWANQHVGFRFEARGYWTDISEEDYDDRYDYRYDDDLYQFEVTAGLQFAF